MLRLGHLAVLVAAMGGCDGCEEVASPEAAATEPTSQLPLAPKDHVRLAQQRKIIRTAFRAHYGENLLGTKADLPFLQRLLDDGVFSSEEVYERQSVAVAFGDVLSADLPLRWVMVMDAYGSEPALCCRKDGSPIELLPMVTAPLERGERVDLAALAEAIRAEVE